MTFPRQRTTPPILRFPLRLLSTVVSTPASRWTGVTLRLAALFALTAGAVAAEVARRAFDLPADAAEQSLKRFSAQSGLQVVFASEVTDGVRANPVKGDFTPVEAANRLLAGTPLRVTHDDKTGVLSVTRISPPERASPEKKARRAALKMAGGRPTTPSKQPSNSPLNR